MLLLTIRKFLLALLIIAILVDRKCLSFLMILEAWEPGSQPKDQNMILMVVTTRNFQLEGYIGLKINTPHPATADSILNQHRIDELAPLIVFLKLVFLILKLDDGLIQRSSVEIAPGNVPLISGFATGVLQENINGLGVAMTASDIGGAVAGTSYKMLIECVMAVLPRLANGLV